MNQILHIFKKDIRRHWPEILISLTFLALFARRQLKPWPLEPDFVSVRYLFFFQFTRLITPLLVIFWVFLILRVVHSETLVGDRQWWVTKPYVWWKLLLAKLFFLFVFISVPLFHVQLLLIHHAGFPVLSNLGPLVLAQFTLPCVIMICAFALAALTRNLVQALLGVGIVIVVIIAGLWLDSLFSHMTGDSFPFIDTLETLVLFGSLVLVPIWQFARRRAWASRIILAATTSFLLVISTIPLARTVEQSYPLLSADKSPVQFSIPHVPESQGNPSGSLPFTSDTMFSISLNVYGVTPGTVVLIDGMKLSADLPSGSQWTHGWTTQYHQVWPGTQRETLTYEVKRKQYEEIMSKPLNLRIELAFSEYREADSRTLVLPATTFHDDQFGICRLHPLALSSVQCLKPFNSPSFLARFDAPNSPCRSTRRFPDSSPTNLDIAYAWSYAQEKFMPDPGLNPIVQYAISFNSTSKPSAPVSATQAEYSVPTLCPGAEIHVARPVLTRKFRVQLDLPNARLEDLVDRGAFAGRGRVAIGL